MSRCWEAGKGMRREGTKGEKEKSKGEQEQEDEEGASSGGIKKKRQGKGTTLTVRLWTQGRKDFYNLGIVLYKSQSTVVHNTPHHLCLPECPGPCPSVSSLGTACPPHQ